MVGVQSVFDKMLGMAVIATIISIIAGLYWGVRFLISKFKDNRKKAVKIKLETEGYGISNGIGRCFNCDERVTFEKKESSLFCPECGWEREAAIQKRLENKKNRLENSVIVTNETTKKIVAREGLFAIGAFLLANLICFVITLLVCKRSHLYLFEDALKAFLILYGSYLIGRFVIWSIKTLKTTPRGKLSKVFKIVIYSLLILFALVYFGNYFDDTKKQHSHYSRF